MTHAQDSNAAVPAPEVLLANKWQFVLCLSASELDCYMSDVEDRHAHCKASGQPGTSAELLFAKYASRLAMRRCCDAAGPVR